MKLRKKIVQSCFFLVIILILIEFNEKNFNRINIFKFVYKITNYVEENFYIEDTREAVFINNMTNLNSKCNMPNLEPKQEGSMFYYNLDKNRLSFLFEQCKNDSGSHFLNKLLSISYLKEKSIEIKLNSSLVFEKFNQKFECEFQRFEKKLNQSENLYEIENLGQKFKFNGKNGYQILLNNQFGFYHLKCYNLLIIKSILFEYVYTIYPFDMNDLKRSKIKYRKLIEGFISKFNDTKNYLSDKKFDSFGLKDLNHDFKKMNVLLIGIDSASQNQFKRNFPETYDYLSKSEDYEIFNYLNSVGINTYPTILALLTGMAEEKNYELNITSEIDYYRELDSTYHDHIPFIWKEYEKNGYLTMYQEDYPLISIFNYYKKGFRYLPTSLYDRGYWLKYYQLRSGPDKCHLEKPTYKTWLEKIDQFIIHMNSNQINQNIPYFSFNFITEYTHEYLAVSKHFDLKLKEFIEKLNLNGHLDNTLFLLFGDHGSRLSYYAYATEPGKIEKWMPFLSIRLPKILKRTIFSKNLNENKDTLISFFDLYQTLRQFLFINKYGIQYSDDWRLQFRKNDFKVRNLRGISLLEKININRSCTDALIPEEFCSCLDSEFLNYETTFIKETGETYDKIGNIIVDYINRLTEQVRSKCFVYKLKKIQTVKKYFRKDKHSYKMTVILEPGEAWFEVGLILNGFKSIKINTNIKRLSPYRDTSSCISDDISLLDYCYCKKDYL